MKIRWTFIKILYVLIPLFTIGFAFFETTSCYDKLFGFNVIDNVIYNKWLANDGNVTTEVSRSLNNTEFKSIYKLIKDNTPYKVLEDEPLVIYPIDAQIGYIYPVSMYVWPEYAPIIYFRHGESREESNHYPVASIGDMKNWEYEKKEYIRFWAVIIPNALLLVLAVYDFMIFYKKQFTKRKIKNKLSK